MTNYFSKNLKYLRRKKNIDQQVMAEDLGIAQSTLSCYENGLRTPDLDMVSKISSYLNITDDFITKDLTVENSKSLDELDILFNKNKDILTDEDKEYMKFIIEKRKKKVDKHSGNKS